MGHDEESLQRTWVKNKHIVIAERTKRAENAWSLQRGHNEQSEQSVTLTCSSSSFDVNHFPYTWALFTLVLARGFFPMLPHT